MAIIKSKKNSKASKLNKKKTMKRNSKKNVSRKMRGGAHLAAPTGLSPAAFQQLAAVAMTKQAVAPPVASVPVMGTLQRQKLQQPNAFDPITGRSKLSMQAEAIAAHEKRTKPKPGMRPAVGTKKPRKIRGL